MSFELNAPDVEATKAKVEQELAVQEAQAEIIDNAAAEKG